MEINILEGLCKEYFELIEAKELLDDVLFFISPYDRTINDKPLPPQLIQRMNFYRKFDDSE